MTETFDSGSVDEYSKAFTYNKLGQLTGYSKDNVAVATYAYNAEGLRKSKTVGTETTEFYYYNGTIINEVKDNTLYATNILGASGISQRKIGTDTAYFVKNGHGDTVKLIDEEGTEISDYEYDIWGKEESTTGTFDNPYRYTGEYYDEESGMIYLRNRYYNPETHRFMTEDPIKDGMNWYAYCSNNPIIYVDPWGLDDYIFYGKDQETSAQSYKQHLIKENPDNPVHMIYVWDAEDFETAWNEMGYVDGEEVSIDNVIINLHGNPECIVASNDEVINIHGLERKTIDTIVLLSCNTGNMNYRNNVAVQMAMYQIVNRVIAPDGYSARTNNNYNGALINIFSSYASVKSGDSYDKDQRAGNGYIIYQRSKGKMLTVTVGISQDREKFKNVYDLIDIAKSNDIYSQNVNENIERIIGWNLYNGGNK